MAWYSSPPTPPVYLLWKELSWPIIVRFIALMPFGVALGLLVFQGLPTAAVQLLIGLFVLASLFTRQIGRWRESEVPLWAFVAIGFAYNLALGALNRAMPQLLVALVGVPFIVWIGMVVLYHIMPALYDRWDESLQRILLDPLGGLG